LQSISYYFIKSELKKSIVFKKQLIVIFGLLLTASSFSQNTFVKGYYIDNSNKKITCLIKNEDWLNNPTKFKYKTNLDSEIKTVTINDVKEFGVLNTFKYKRYDVDIDRSTKKTDELDNNKNPVFNKEKLFLKLLIEGKANLYYYEDGGLVRYFFNKNNTDVKQLVSKYYLTDENQVNVNKQFRRQLWIDLKCESISMNSLERVNYEKSDLMRFFIKYNECSNAEFVNYQQKKKNKDSFNLSIRPGIRNSSLILFDPNDRKTDFGNNLTSFRLGLEAEFILGFNNNKWAFLLEPTYHQFSSGIQGSSFNQKRIEVNVGLRHYMYLKNKDVKFFLNAAAFYVNNFNSQLNDGSNSFSIKIDDTLNIALGIGCRYKERFSVELRYLPSGNFNILDSYDGASWYTRSQSSSIVLGYSIF